MMIEGLGMWKTRSSLVVPRTKQLVMSTNYGKRKRVGYRNLIFFRGGCCVLMRGSSGSQWGAEHATILKCFGRNKERERACRIQEPA